MSTMPYSIHVKAKYIGREKGGMIPENVYTIQIHMYTNDNQISYFDNNKDRIEYVNLKHFLEDWSYVTLQPKK